MSLVSVAQGETEHIIYGPASVEIQDSEGEIIKAEALENALPQLLRRARFSKKHQDIIVGEILSMYKDTNGKIWKTEVRLPNAEDLRMFSKLKKDVPALFTVGNVYGDSNESRLTRQLIMDNKLDSLSISGAKLSGNPGEVSMMDLDAITICERGMNPYAKFKTIAKSDEVKAASECLPGGETKNNEVKKMPEEVPEEATAPEQPPAADETANVVEQLAMQIGELSKRLEAAVADIAAMKTAKAEDTEEEEEEEEKPDEDVEKDNPVLAKLSELTAEVKELRKSSRVEKAAAVERPQAEDNSKNIVDLNLTTERIAKEARGISNFMSKFRSEIPAGVQ